MTGEHIARSMAYKATFGSEHGRKVLEDLDRQYNWLNPDRCYESESERNTCYNLGKLVVLRYIHSQIDAILTETKDNKAIHKEI